MQQTKMAAPLSEHTAATWAAMFHSHFLFTLVDYLGTITTILSITGGSPTVSVVAVEVGEVRKECRGLEWESCTRLCQCPCTVSAMAPDLSPWHANRSANAVLFLNEKPTF